MEINTLCYTGLIRPPSRLPSFPHSLFLSATKGHSHKAGFCPPQKIIPTQPVIPAKAGISWNEPVS